MDDTAIPLRLGSLCVPGYAAIPMAYSDGPDGLWLHVTMGAVSVDGTTAIVCRLDDGLAIPGSLTDLRWDGQHLTAQLSTVDEQP